MLIILNPHSGGRNAERKWKHIERDIMARPRTTLVTTETAEEVDAAIIAHVADGERNFVAAGGDGTVNGVLQALMRNSGTYPDLALGAIGLGSSNDFHKPFGAREMLHGIPLLIDFSHSARRDVGVLGYLDPIEGEVTRYWLLNASVGVTAEANACFNLESPSRVLELAKKLNTNAAILYAALRTILFYRNLELALGTCSSETHSRVTNLGIAKSPHFAGSFKYDSPFEPGSGRFYTHLVHDLGLGRILQLLYQLSHGKFAGFPNAESFSTEDLLVESDSPFAVEFDGEVARTKRAHFSIRKEHLLIAS